MNILYLLKKQKKKKKNKIKFYENEIHKIKYMKFCTLILKNYI